MGVTSGSIQGQHSNLVILDEVPSATSWTWNGQPVSVGGRGNGKSSGKLNAMAEVLVKDFLPHAASDFLELCGDQPLLDARASTFMGVKVTIQNVAVGRVTCEITKQRLVMDGLTWTALYEEYVELRRSRTALTPKIDAVLECMSEAASSVRTRVVDVSAMGRPVVPMRDTRRPADRSVSLDRLERVVMGLRELATQLASFGSREREASPEQVTMFAARYGELAEEMRVVRAAVTEAEGNLDVVQMQIVRLMES